MAVLAVSIVNRHTLVSDRAVYVQLRTSCRPVTWQRGDEARHSVRCGTGRAGMWPTAKAVPSGGGVCEWH